MKIFRSSLFGEQLLGATNMHQATLEAFNVSSNRATSCARAYTYIIKNYPPILTMKQTCQTDCLKQHFILS